MRIIYITYTVYVILQMNNFRYLCLLSRNVHRTPLNASVPTAISFSRLSPARRRQATRQHTGVFPTRPFMRCGYSLASLASSCVLGTSSGESVYVWRPCPILANKTNTLPSGYILGFFAFKLRYIALTRLVAPLSLPRECRTQTICIANARVVQLVASTFTLLPLRGVVILRPLGFQVEQEQHQSPSPGIPVHLDYCYRKLSENEYWRC